jgi:hypothetical protein
MDRMIGYLDSGHWEEPVEGLKSLSVEAGGLRQINRIFVQNH